MFEQKFQSIEEKILKYEEKSKKKGTIEKKYEEMIDRKLKDFEVKARSNSHSRSRSPDTLRKKLEDMSIVQGKLEKIVIDTAEKVKKTKNKEGGAKENLENSKFNKAVEKIGDLLKKYSRAQESLFTNVKSLEEKTRVLEEKFENSRSFAISEPVDIYRQPSFSSIDENFKISFGSEESHPNKAESKCKTKKVKNL